MKITLLNTFTLSPRTTLFQMILLMFMATCVQEAMASGSKGDPDIIVVSKIQGTKKHKVKLYPNATHEVLFFNAIGEEDKIYQLFIFDHEGKLTKQTMVRNRQTSFLTKFNKGDYTYEVFCNDQRIENGNVSIQ
ncbi:MAG: hypothetical protein H7Y03_10525 [Chitinophagaceae bacterium]|nr:hypothetical protein [Chitinophagaceae bacterium]